MPEQKILAVRLSGDEMHARIFKATVYEIFRLVVTRVPWRGGSASVDCSATIIARPRDATQYFSLTRDTTRNWQPAICYWRYTPGTTAGERENHSKLQRNNHVFYYCIKALQ